MPTARIAAVLLLVLCLPGQLPVIRVAAQNGARAGTKVAPVSDMRAAIERYTARRLAGARVSRSSTKISSRRSKRSISTR
jgi:hypothetical protein